MRRDLVVFVLGVTFGAIGALLSGALFTGGWSQDEAPPGSHEVARMSPEASPALASPDRE